MSSRHHPLSTLQPLLLAAALLLCSGCLTSAFGQRFPGERGVSNFDRAPNPQTNVSHPSSKRSETLAKRTSSGLPQPLPDTPKDEKQQAIELAIEQGNKARDANEYEQALAHYQKAHGLNSQEARAFYGMGNIYTDFYCHDSAIEAYLKALKVKKDYLDAFIGLGYAYVNKERYDDALAQFEEVLKLAPANVGASLGVGSILARKGKYNEATEQINKVINSESVEAKDQAVAHVVLGSVYFRQSMLTEAAAQFEKAIKLDPNLATAYLSLGVVQTSAAFSNMRGFESVDEVNAKELAVMKASAKKATDSLEKAGEKGYKHPALHESLALSLAYQFRFRDAIAQLETYFAKVKQLESRLSPLAMKCDTGFIQLNAEGHWYLGWVRYVEGHFEADNQRKTEIFNQAIKQLDNAIKLKQDFSSAYWTMAMIYVRQQKHEDAISQYKNVIRYGIEEHFKSSVYQAIGLAYSKKGRQQEALEHVNEAIRLDPNNPSHYESLASIYVTQGNLEETFNALKKATEIRKTPATDPDPYYYLGATYAIRYLKEKKEGDFDEAIKWLKKAIEIKPSYVYAYVAMGSAYQAHSNGDEALTIYKRAAEYEPKNPDIYFDMAGVYFELKHNGDEAIRLLKKAIELRPDFAKAYRFIGEVYKAKKNYDDALTHIRKAIEIDPNYSHAYLDLANIYRVQKNYPDAIKYLNKAIEITPTDPVPYKDLGNVYGDLGQTENAVHYYEEASSRLDANDSSTRNLYLGRIARLRGHYAEAIEYFRKLNFPDGPAQSNFDIGVTYVVSGNKRSALEQHEQLVKLKSPLAEELLKKIKEMK